MKIDFIKNAVLGIGFGATVAGCNNGDSRFGMKESESSNNQSEEKAKVNFGSLKDLIINVEIKNCLSNIVNEYLWSNQPKNTKITNGLEPGKISLIYNNLIVLLDTVLQTNISPESKSRLLEMDSVVKLFEVLAKKFKMSEDKLKTILASPIGQGSYFSDLNEYKMNEGEVKQEKKNKFDNFDSDASADSDEEKYDNKNLEDSSDEENPFAKIG